MVKKNITNLNSSKASGAVTVLKNYEPELSHMLAKFFNVSERVLFSRLLEGLIGGPCI